MRDTEMIGDSAESIIDLYADCAACGHARHHHLGGGACGKVEAVTRCPCNFYASKPEGTQH